MRLIKATIYFTLRFFVKVGLYFYFRKIKVSGIENIPKEGPVIYGANHESAFMDALLLTTHTTHQCHYLVRADVFKNVLIRKVLALINMMPVYRIRDGFGSLKSNVDIFANCYKLLGRGDSLIMFPEGNHDIRRVERKLTKGISRIALGAINDSYGPKDLQIVPVGLNYTHHKQFRSAVHIVFGQPIPVAKIDSNSQNQDTLRNEISAGLNNTHIRLPIRYYDFFYSKWIKMKIDLGLQNPILINQQINDHLKSLESQNPEELNKLGTKFQESLQYFGSSYQQLKGNFWGNFPLLLIAFPMLAYGFVCNAVPILILKLITSKIIKDHIFDASIKFTVGYLLFFLNYTALTILFSTISEAFWTRVLFTIGLPISLLMYHYSLDFINAVNAQYKFRYHLKWRNKLLEEERTLMTS